MRPGTVYSDDEAFQKILGRLKGEVGQLIRLIGAAKLRGEAFAGTAPFWSLVRMTFPIAESLGDLLYRNDDSTAANLQSILENEFEAVRPGYRSMAAILTVMYRHALMHHDEQRLLLTSAKEIDWFLGFGAREHHLQVAKAPPNVIEVRFDTTAFYDDLVAVCEGQIGRHSDGKIRDRYNGWQTLDLDTTRQTSAVKNAIREINAL